MLRCVITCNVLVVFAGLSKGGEIPNYNLTVSNVHNGTGSWFVELRLEHDNAQVYDMYLSNSKDATVARISPPGGHLHVEGSQEGPKTCPVPKALGYELVPRMGYYKLFLQNLKPWDGAKKTCESEGTHLLIINSDLEAFVIKAMVERNPTSRGWGHWIGFQDVNKTGDYRTIFNDTLDSTGYNIWRQGQPSADGTHRCGYFQSVTDKITYGLALYFCGHANPFICEQEIDG